MTKAFVVLLIRRKDRKAAWPDIELFESYMAADERIVELQALHPGEYEFHLERVGVGPFSEVSR